MSHYPLKYWLKYSVINREKYFFVFLILFLILFVSCSNDSEDITEPEEFDFSDREYVVYSEGVNNYTPAPVLFVLHGANSSNQSMIQATNFNFIAGEEGYLIVYPNAFQGLWNFNGECGLPYEDRPNDVEFIKYILNDISDKYNIDTKRIFITGFSMGGYFAYYLAKKMPGTFAAIAPVAATMPRYLSKDFNTNKISVLIELGTKDASVPYEGSGAEDCGNLSGEESIKYWAKLNGCDSEPNTSYLPDNGIDYLNIRIDNFNFCESGFEVKLISVEGGSHRWYMNDEIKISNLIFDFIKDKSL